MVPDGPARIELRLGTAEFAEIRSVLESAAVRERAVFLFVRPAVTTHTLRLLVIGWREIPDGALIDADGHGLRWTAAYNADVLKEARRRRTGLVLIHSHGEWPARFSQTDAESASSLMPPLSRLVGHPAASIILGGREVVARTWRDGHELSGIPFRITTVGDTICTLPPPTFKGQPAQRRRLNRQTLAFGRRSDILLRSARVAVIGLCGGGSHVVQQLAHAGIGSLTLIDPQCVEEVNRGRMVGSHDGDDGLAKTFVAERLARSIDPSIAIQRVAEPFPAPAALTAVKDVDIVVSCVDSFLVRQQINAFCRRHHLPLVDIGLTIETEDERLVCANGQVVVVTPDQSCLRCSPLLSDAVLEKERTGRPPGYDRNPGAQGDPQVVSMNGVLASEAVNCVLHLLTGYAGTSRLCWRLYDGRSGSLIPSSPPPLRAGCDACVERGQGDPDTY